MELWKSAESAPFESFGLDRLMPHPRSELGRVDSEDKQELRQLVRRHSPRMPGVYGMLDVLGHLIYVGKSKYLRSRLLSYFMPTNEEEKPGRIIEAATSIVWEIQPSDFAAMLREQGLIRRFQPKYNYIGIPNRQQPVFVCIGRSPAEMLYTAKTLDEKARHCEGPFMGAQRANRAIEVLNRVFGFRDCSSKTNFVFADQLSLFDVESRPGCLRYEIGNCLGPCVEGCSRSKYQIKVEQAIEYLKSGNQGPVEVVSEMMTRAAQRRHFEQAARLHEDVKAVKWLTNRLADHAQTRRSFTCVYPLSGVDGRDIWYFIRHGVIEHAIIAPQSQKHMSKASQQVRQWIESSNVIGQHYAKRGETISIVNGWFRKYTQEKRRLINVEDVMQSAPLRER